MTRRIAITQSNYLPWKGYFDLIRSVDAVVLYDEVQFTRRDWRNRNQILTRDGLSWLTVPVQVKGKYDQTIDSTLVSGNSWAQSHWKSIAHAYARADFFTEYSRPFRDFYEKDVPEHLSEINRSLIEIVLELLQISTPLSWSRDFPRTHEGRTERLVSICLSAGATTYVSGPAAKNYLDVGLFEREQITVEWFDYDGYPEYRQLHRPFVHNVSAIDLLLNMGPDSLRFLNRADR
jgi:WbqC-like protein